MRLLLFLTTLSLLTLACSTTTVAPRADIVYAPTPSPRPGPVFDILELAAPEFTPPADMVITTGVHGNEPSGYLVQSELGDMGFTVFGPCNPWGIENNSRYLEDGRDLNRIFANDDGEEVQAVKAFLKEHPPGFLLDLHEDPDGTGPYLIQHGPEDTIGRRIVDALEHQYDFDPAPRFLMVEGEDGLLKPTRQHLRGMKFLKVYGLGYYAWLTYGCTTIVVECPGSWPKAKRKQYQLDVCQTAAKLYAGADKRPR